MEYKLFAVEKDMQSRGTKAQHVHANRLMISKFKQESPDNDTPEQRLIRLTVEHPRYSLDYSFNSCSEGWLVSDVGKKMSEMMISTEMVAVDCEMVLCEDGTEGLVRVGVVDRNLRVILNEFVKPDKPIVDYRTTITGLTSEDLKKATLSLSDIQEKLWPFLSSGATLVGHSLSHDLEVLKIDHPKVIDTSFVFKYPNARNNRRPSLNDLCKFMLGFEVRKAGVSHDCVHDAVAAMKLAIAVIEKRIDTSISLSKEMMENEKSRLFIHRIPSYVSSAEKLEQILSKKFISKMFTVDFKPAKTLGGYHCAIVIFNNSKDADQAFKNVDGYQEKDSLGLPQKHTSAGLLSSFYVRKMVQDE